MSNFDLEERIMDCWKVVDDIEFIYKEYLDSPKYLKMKWLTYC